MATYPASEGLTSVQIAALVHEHRQHDPRRARAAARPDPRRSSACPDRPAALDAAHFGDQEGGRRRLAFDEFLLLQIALLRRRVAAPRGRPRRRAGSRRAR